MAEKTCPLGHTCDKCKWNIRVRGMDPQSGQEIDREDCAIAWIPTLLIDTARQTYSVGGAVESLRETVASGNSKFNEALVRLAEEESESKRIVHSRKKLLEPVQLDGRRAGDNDVDSGG
jgi:hypothetical protein